MIIGQIQGVQLFRTLSNELILCFTLFYLIIFMLCIKFKSKHRSLSLNKVKTVQQLKHNDHDKFTINQSKQFITNAMEDRENRKYSIPNSGNSNYAETYESNQNQTNSVRPKQLTSLHHSQLSNGNILSTNKSNYSYAAQHHCNQISIKNTLTTTINFNEKQHLSRAKSFSFTVWFIKMTRKLLHWKNTFNNNVNLSTYQNNNCTHTILINDEISLPNQNSAKINAIQNENLCKSTIQNNSMDEKENLKLNILYIKQKANSWKEPSRKVKLNHNYHPIWTDTKSVAQSYSNSNTRCCLSSYRQFESQSDLFDPVYSIIQYPVEDTLRSTHSSSSCNYSSVSMHQPYAKDCFLGKNNIWTSQDSIVSDAHVYCELIKLRSDKSHQPINKKVDYRSLNKNYSTCSLYSYDNQCFFQDVISDQYSTHSVVKMKHSNEPPKLPVRTYGESTLNLVANLRLWTMRNKEIHLKNLRIMNKLRKPIHSMLDMNWRLDNKQNGHEFLLRKIKNYSDQTSLKKTPLGRYHKRHYFGKRDFVETPIDYNELIRKHLTLGNTSSLLSESDVISLENLNSPNFRGSSQYRRDHPNQWNETTISGCHSNEAFCLESCDQYTKQSTNFNDICNNLRHIDSESDITESSPYRTKSPGSKHFTLNNNSSYYLQRTSTSFTPLCHIYIPTHCKPTQTQQSNRNVNSFTHDINSKCHEIYHHTLNQMNTEDIPYSSLSMPPLMERSMEDDECHLYK
ncbi:unnamed protein product [Schistosoma turkestanicum]|nr:unnamed protein product [Schistosoma turkestanicum]